MKRYVQRVREARGEVADVVEAMAAEEQRRGEAGEAFVEDDRFTALQDRAERADAALRAAWRGRDLDSDDAAGDPDRAVAQARDAVAEAVASHQQASDNAVAARRSELADYAYRGRQQEQDLDRDDATEREA